MQTRLSTSFQHRAEGQEAEAILRSCVHCGFCNATCPTYQLLGDELDGPRGRIYLIKQVLEGQTVSQATQQHLDRCLTCRACETTCPSGVQYGRLLDIGRQQMEHQAPRTWLQRGLRWLLCAILPYPRRFQSLLRLGQGLRPILPTALRRKLPARQCPSAGPPPAHANSHPRKMLALAGCVQSVATPRTHEAAVRILDTLGIALITAPQAGCCGAMPQHLSAQEQALGLMRRNIDAWWPYLEQGAEAIITTASGCGVMLQDYGHLLQHDVQYAAKAARVSALAQDISTILAQQPLAALSPFKTTHPLRVAFHAPCTLQHGQRLPGQVETLLQQLGYDLTPVVDSHLCCGSAGTYSLLQPQLSQQLLQQKLAALQQPQPEVIVTANIGCQLHLASQAGVPVMHWLELLTSQRREG